jgi:hypothetical protein
MKVERLGRLHQPPRIHRAGGLPSARYSGHFRSLPVEGSKAWRDAQPILSRIFSR